MNTTEDADRFLIGAIRKGDQRAWHQLIERYSGRLLAFARGRLRGAGEAEDALQETFMGLVTSLRHFDEERSLETYLFAILRYKIGEILTKKKRRPEFSPGFDVEEDSSGGFEPSGGETPSGIAVHQEQSARQFAVLASVLRRLIEEVRDRGKLEDLQVIELLFYVGLRNKEVAERLGRDEKGVAGVKFRALGRLREFVEELGEAERILLGDAPIDSEVSIARVWRQGRLSCLKRSTIGSQLLGVLEEPWAGYVRFHLEEVKCLMCRANLEDLSREVEEGPQREMADRFFQSSVGFLSRGEAG